MHFTAIGGLEGAAVGESVAYHDDSTKLRLFAESTNIELDADEDLPDLLREAADLVEEELGDAET